MSAAPQQDAIETHIAGLSITRLAPYVIIRPFSEEEVKRVNPNCLYVFVSHYRQPRIFSSNVAIVLAEPLESLDVRIKFELNRLIDKALRIEETAEKLNGIRAVLLKSGVRNIQQLVDKLYDRPTPEHHTVVVKLVGFTAQEKAGINETQLLQTAVEEDHAKYDVTVRLVSRSEIKDTLKQVENEPGKHILLVRTGNSASVEQEVLNSDRRIARCIVNQTPSAKDLASGILDGVDWFNYSALLPPLKGLTGFEELRDELKHSLEGALKNEVQ